MAITNMDFYNHEIINKDPDKYCEILLPPESILSAWSHSLNCYDYLDKAGHIKAEETMDSQSLKKFLSAFDCFKRGEPTAKPVIGIGIMDTVEIGIGAEIIVAATAFKYPLLPVHVRKAQESDLRKILKR